MAEVITKFKLETTQYDSALRDAANSLSKLSGQLSMAGKDFDKFAQKSVDQARALGQIESGATNVKDKLRDLVNAYNNVAKAYNNLTNEQKQTDFGKAMSQSLQELQGRIKEAKRDMEDFKSGSQNAGNILDQLAGKFGISTKALTTWGAAIGAGAAALKVAKDSFFASEQNIDDWGRTIEMANTTYEAFLTSLNTGDISGFLSRIGQIQQAAFDAYNAIDRLQTMQNIQSPKVAQKQAEVQRMETMLRTGRYVAPIDGRTSTEGLKTGDVLTAEQKKRIADQLASGMKEIAALTKNEVSAATDAINVLYREQAQVLGMSNEEFKKGTASMAAFEANLEKARKYREFEAQHTTRTQMNTSAGVVTQNVRDNVANPYEAYKNWAVFKDDGKLYQRLINEIKNRSQAESQYYSQMGRAYRGINRAEGITPYGGSGNKQLTAPEKAQQKFEQAEKDYHQALEQAALEVKAGTANTAEAKKKELSAAENLWKSIGDAREIYDSEELKKAQEDAAKKVVELGGSVNALIEEQKKAQEAARELTAAQKKAAEANRKMADALAANDYKAYSAAYKQYQTAKAGVQRLGGELPKLDGKKIIYTVEVDDEQLAKLKDLQTDDKTIKINVEEGMVNLPLLPKDDETIHFNVEPGEVNLPDIPKEFDQTVNTKVGDVELPDIPKIYTVTIEAETDQAVRNIDAAVADMNSMKVEIPVSVEKPEPVDVPVNMSYTDNNLSAFIGNLKQELSQAPLGSELYKNLTAQLADANMLANLMQTAVKNGIDAAQFDPQTLFNKIFGENPGDYIKDEKWQEIRKKIEEIIGKPITIDVNTGTVNVENAKGKSAEKGKSDYNKIVGSMSTITGALQQLGVEVPEGFSKTLGILQVISTITMAIQSLAAVTATTSALKAIPIIGWFLHNGGVVHAASGYSVPGNNYSGDMVPAMLNSGELVLNKAQQGNLASQLQDGGNGGNVGRSMATIESDQIRIVLQNGAQAKGITLGEYLGI